MRLAELQPGSHAHLRLRVLDALYGDGDSASAEAAVRDLQRRSVSRAGDGPATRAVELADACVISQWRLHRNDTTASAGHRTAETGVPHGRPRRTSSGRGFPGLQRATPGLAGRRARCSRCGSGSRPARLARPLPPGRVGMRPRTPQCSSPVCTSTLAILDAALAAVRRRADHIGWPRYLDHRMEEEGRYAMAAGAHRRGTGGPQTLPHAPIGAGSGAPKPSRRGAAAVGVG